ncbi:hypothetical protein [Mycobacterium sp. 3519A]|nr:hypothetical protein [Mycobacterium sp. 3519A]
MSTIVLIVIAFVVVDMIALGFVVWWRIFRRPRNQPRSGQGSGFDL